MFYDRRSCLFIIRNVILVLFILNLLAAFIIIVEEKKYREYNKFYKTGPEWDTLMEVDHEPIEKNYDLQEEIGK